MEQSISGRTSSSDPRAAAAHEKKPKPFMTDDSEVNVTSLSP